MRLPKQKKSNSKSTARIAVVAISAAIASATPALSATLTRAIEAGLLSTDNATLAETGLTRSLVGRIKPSAELTFETRNFDTKLLGELEYFRFGDPDRDIFDPRLFARTKGTLIPNLLFLDSSARVTKVTTEEDIFRLTEDSESSLRFQISPTLERSFGTFADLSARYQHQTIDEGIEDGAETIRNGFDIALQRNPVHGNFIWGVGGSYSLDRGGIDRVENTTAFGELGFTVAQIYLFKGRAGFEENDFANIEEEDRESPFWNVSMTWTPSERTAFTVGYGERFFGGVPSLQLKHTTRNSTVTLAWTRGITRARATLDGINTLADSGDDTITVLPTTDADNTANNANQIAAEPFVDNQIRLSYKLSGRRSDLIIDALYSEQQELSGQSEITRTIGRIAFDRRLSPLTTLRLGYDYLDSNANGNNNNLTFTENRLGISFKYELR